MTKNDSNELLDVLSILSLEMAKYNLRNNLEALKNDIENYNKKKLGEMEEPLVNKHFLQVLHSKNKDNNYQPKIIKSYKRYNSSKLMKKYENNNKNNFSPKKSVDMTKDKYQIKSMLVESKEKNDEKPLSSIKRAKRYDSRKSTIVIPILSENEQADKNINKDFENSKSNYSNSKINNEKKDDSNTFTISESDSDSDSSNDKKSKNRSEKISKNKNLENRNIENSQKVLKTYIKKLSFRFEDKKVSFHVEDNIYNKSNRSNSRKNSILSEDVLKKNSSIMNNNQKINNNINSNTNKNRISNLKNYKPNYQNKQNNQNNQNNINYPIKNNNSDNNNNTQKKQKNSIESVKEKISLIAEESLNKEKSPKVEEKVKFKRGCKKHRTLYSTLTSPLELTNVIKDVNFMDIINDDFSLSDQGASFTKEDLEVNLLSQLKQSYINNLELTNSYNNYYSSKSLEMLKESSSSNTSKKKKKEKIIEESPFMKKYQISSSFAERQMKILQIKNNNINKLKIKLEKKNIFEHSPKINSNSQKLIKKKGIYIPIFKRSVKIQYDKNVKFNLFSKMRKDSKIKNEKNKGHISYRGQGKNSNNKIVKFFESQISWKEKVNSKTKKLKNSLEKEKENSLNEELLFKPIIFNNSEYKIKNKSKSIFMKLYNDQNIKEKNLEKLKKKLTPSFIPNINDEKRLHYYNKKNNNILNNYSKFNMNNSNNTSRLRNNISSNFKNLNKILYYEEEDSSAALTNRLKGFENLEISKIKKDNIKKIEKDDTLASLTGLESDLTNNKFPNINETNSICLGHGFIYPDSDRNIIYNQYNNINNNYINYSNKSEILKNKIMHEKENRFNQKKEDIDEISNKSLLSYLKGDNIVNPNKSMEIISGNVKNYVNSYYENLNFEKIRDNYNCKIEDELKSEILKNNKINNISEEKDDQSIYFDLWNFNNKQNKIVDERKEKDKKKKYNEYSYIMKEKKEKIKQLKYIK